MTANLKSIAVPMKRNKGAARLAQLPAVVDGVAPMARSIPTVVARQINHLYKAGDRLLLLSNVRVGKAASPCVILRLMPFEGRDFQYRVQDDAEGRERVVSEADLQVL